MPQVIRSSVAVANGENGVTQILITLDLNINLNTNGISIDSAPAPVEKPALIVPSKQNDDDHVDFIIPDFGSNEMISFGKKV